MKKLPSDIFEVQLTNSEEKNKKIANDEVELNDNEEDELLEELEHMIESDVKVLEADAERPSIQETNDYTDAENINATSQNVLNETDTKTLYNETAIDDSAKSIDLIPQTREFTENITIEETTIVEPIGTVLDSFTSTESTNDNTEVTPREDDESETLLKDSEEPSVVPVNDENSEEDPQGEHHALTDSSSSTLKTLDYLFIISTLLIIVQFIK